VVQEMLQGMPLDKLRALAEPKLQLAPNRQVLAPPAAPKARAAQVDIPVARMECSEIRVSCNDRTGLLRSIRATKPLPGMTAPRKFTPLYPLCPSFQRQIGSSRSRFRLFGNGRRGFCGGNV